MSEDTEMRDERADAERAEDVRDDRPRPTGAKLRDRLEGRRVEPDRGDERAQARRAEPEPAGARATLFEEGRASDLRSRWTEVQGRFVDDPRDAVKAADTLVKEVIDDLSQQFSKERSTLEGQWGRNEKVSTEDLRIALQRYREFFERLLSV